MTTRGPATAQRWRVDEEDDGARLDRFLAARLEQARNQLQRWIREGRVTVDRAVAARPATALAAGQEVACTPPPPVTSDPRVEPEQGELAILAEDGWLIVVDKPAGLTVHPGAGRPTGTLVHRLLARYPELAGVGGPGRPGIVHRLDHGTSGVMVVARTAAAHRRLSAAFARRRVDKRYLAIAYGDPGSDPLTVDRPIGRHPTRRKEMAVRPGGRPAKTRLTRLALAADGRVSLLAADLLTGRTHQIRVHAKAAGHPLIGDPTYGEARHKDCPPRHRAALASFPRPALHAWKLALAHPEDDRPVEWTAPPPDDLDRLWRQLAGESLEGALGGRG